MGTVGIVADSDFALTAIKEAAKVLEEFGIGYEIDVISPHLQPDKVHEYATGAAERFEVIIAAGSGAAHLPGVIASLTPLPVIGVPLETETLSGLDSLFSMVQMPKGIPVATVSIGRAGAVNAAILAAQILSAKHPELKEKIKRYKKGMAEEVIKRGERLRDVGYKRYQELKKT